MRKTLLLPPTAYLLVVPALFPLLLAGSGAIVAWAYVTRWPAPGLLATPPFFLGLALFVAGLRELKEMAAIYAAYIRHRGRDASAFALYPGAGSGRETVLRQSHEYADVARFILILFQAAAVMGWTMAAIQRESRHRLVFFAVATLAAVGAFLLFRAVWYAYRWAWSGDARLILTNIPVRTGQDFSGEIFSPVGLSAGMAIQVTVRCKHDLRPSRSWKAEIECLPGRRKGGGLAVRFSVPLPHDQDGVTAIGVDWSLCARSTEPGLVPNFFCVFSGLPILRDPDIPFAWYNEPPMPDEIFDEEWMEEADE